MAKSATTLQLWWNFNHHISNRSGTLTTTYHIQGAGAPAKTKNVNADGVYIFSGKGPTFSASCKTSEHFSLHACMGIRNVNTKHTEYEVRGEKAINNRIET